jgi:SAM-dependent methyltransferase
MTGSRRLRTVGTMTAAETPDNLDIDEEAAEAFAGRLFELFTGAALSALIDIARRTGIFDAAAVGPATSAELAHRAGLQERYVREWLGAMATAGVVEYDADSQRFWLPREHAVCLTGDSPQNLSGLALLTTILSDHVAGVTDAFRHGGGVPYDAFAPDIHDALDALWGPIYSQLLVPEYLPLVPGLSNLLTTAARVADVACGTGRALVALASAFPASTFVGYDLDGVALDRARATAAERRLTNLAFEQADAAELRVAEPFDAIFVFNAIHDQARPGDALARIHDALVPGGIFVMDEPRVSSRLEDNLDNPMAPFTYAVSTLHCLTVSLAAGGAGLGTAWGEELAVQMLHDAGFGPVEVHDAPGDPGNAVFVANRDSGKSPAGRCRS